MLLQFFLLFAVASTPSIILFQDESTSGKLATTIAAILLKEIAGVQVHTESGKASDALDSVSQDKAHAYLTVSHVDNLTPEDFTKQRNCTTGMAARRGRHPVAGSPRQGH